MDGPLGKIAFDFFKGEEVFYKIEEQVYFQVDAICSK